MQVLLWYKWNFMKIKHNSELEKANMFVAEPVLNLWNEKSNWSENWEHLNSALALLAKQVSDLTTEPPFSHL